MASGRRREASNGTDRDREAIAKAREAERRGIDRRPLADDHARGKVPRDRTGAETKAAEPGGKDLAHDPIDG